MDNDHKDWWFPAKKYGYGWGLPDCRQGWLVLFVFSLLVAVGRFFLRGQSTALIIVSYTVLTIVFLGIVYCKGEKRKPRSDD